MPNRFWTKPWLRLTAVMVLAGLLYSSWPLGYWLNPKATHGIASNLEAYHQPYNWVFIVIDIICGAIICLVTIWLFRVIQRRKHLQNSHWLEAAVIGLGIFGLLTALDAVLPLNCDNAAQKCLPSLDDPFFVIHGAANLASIAGLMICLLIIWWLLVRDRRVIEVVRWILHGLLFLWLCFAIGTAVLVIREPDSGLTQHIFILVCSFWIAVVPFFIWEELHFRPRFRKIYPRQSKSKTKKSQSRPARRAKTP